MDRHGVDRLGLDDARKLLEVVQRLSYQRELQAIIDIVKQVARELVASDGVTFVLRDENRCFYVDENAIAPLWKGQRFPANACISGWAMIHRETVVIDDIFADPRIPQDIYRATFVRSLAMVPIRRAEPLGALGAYWAVRRRPTEREIALLELLADSTASAVMNVESNLRLQETVRLREEFITMASHELRTPLTPLRVAFDSAARALAADRPVADVASRLEKAGAHLGRLEGMVGWLVDQVGLWTDRLVLTPTEVDPGALAASVIERLRPRAREVGSLLELERPDPPLSCRWDGPRLDQALTSLVENAIKFGAGARIQVRVEPEGGLVRLRVVDHGAGIPLADQVRIFERFGRQEDSRNFGGFGLGLWTARRIAEAHGGHLTVESVPGQGATFSLTLPRGPARAEDASEGAAAAEHP